MIPTIGRTNASPADFQASMDAIGGKLETRKKEIERAQNEAWALLEAAPMSPAKEAFLTAVAKKQGVSQAFHTLLGEVDGVRLHELQLAYDEERRLSSVVRSFTALCQDLRTANQKPAEEQINPVLARDQYGLRRSLLSDVQAVREALKAAGENAKEVGVFPRAQLDRIATRAEEDAKAILDERERATQGLAVSKTVSAKDLPTVQAAAEHIGKMLGDKGVAAALIAAENRVGRADKATFQRNLTALALLTDWAVTAPDYSTTRSGDTYPQSRSEYRTRQFDAFDLFAAETRLDATQGRLLDVARAIGGSKEPAKDLDKKLVSTFLTEIGVPHDVSKNWRANAEAISKALDHEALLPLRALNETIDDAFHREDAAPFKRELRQTVTDITRHVVEGDFRDWRYTSMASTKQLAGLSMRQKDQWKSNLSVESPAAGGAGMLKTREEDGVDLLWVTKIGGPSHGFDYNPHCLLPLLANGRTKAILVDDPRWPHNAAARCYLRVLANEEGRPMLYLEPSQRDFPHRNKFDTDKTWKQESATVRLVQIKHALAKAQEMGLPLNLSAGDDAILDHLGIAHTKFHGKLLIEPSGGVFEASDTMFKGHDFPQTERLITEPKDLRIMVQPGQLGRAKE